VGELSASLTHAGAFWFHGFAAIHGPRSLGSAGAAKVPRASQRPSDFTPGNAIHGHCRLCGPPPAGRTSRLPMNGTQRAKPAQRAVAAWFPFPAPGGPCHGAGVESRAEPGWRSEDFLERSDGHDARRKRPAR
jgi:hypothetical protein